MLIIIIKNFNINIDFNYNNKININIKEKSKEYIQNLVIKGFDTSLKIFFSTITR